MKKSLVLLAIGLFFGSQAFAELPVSTGTPAMTFKAIQIENTAQLTKERVTPYRLFDKIVVTVFDPVVCGQNPVSPAFKITEKSLALSYDLTAAASGAKKRCALVSEFVVSNVPHGDLQVSFAGGDEPASVAKLHKCPNYQPKTEDIYECLAPTE